MTEHEEREYVAKARAAGKTASVTRGTTTTCYHPNGCVLVFDDGLVEDSIKAAIVKARPDEVVYLDGTDAKIGVPYEHVFADGRRASVTMQAWSNGREVAEGEELAAAKESLRLDLDKARKSLWQQAGGIGAVEFRWRGDRFAAHTGARVFLTKSEGNYLGDLVSVDGDVVWTRRLGRLTWNMVFGFAMPDSSAPTRVDYSSITREIAND